jgi:hypothetical protein
MEALDTLVHGWCSARSIDRLILARVSSSMMSRSIASYDRSSLLCNYLNSECDSAHTLENIFELDCYRLS